MLSNFPAHFAESNAVPAIAPPAVTDQFPDLIVAENAIEARAYLDALGCDVVEWLPNTNPRRCKARVLRGDQPGAILTAPVEQLTVEEIRGKVICGHIPLWMAMHCALLIIFEPAVEPSAFGYYTLGDAAQPPLRLSAYRIHRAGSDPVEGMTI